MIVEQKKTKKQKNKKQKAKETIMNQCNDSLVPKEEKGVVRVKAVPEEKAEAEKAPEALIVYFIRRAMRINLDQ